MRHIFFGYPSHPAGQRDALATAASRIRDTGLVTVQTWEELVVSGHLVIDQVLSAIDKADLSAFDVTGVNPNVAFELGYAIGSNKPVWVLRDPTDVPSQRRWDQIAVLTTLGYRPFTSSDDIFGAFTRDRPDQSPATIFEESIQSSLRAAGRPSIFNVPSRYPTEADRNVQQAIQSHARRGFQQVAADPTEGAVQSLAWYGQAIYAASAVLVRLMPSRRRDADVHNARASLIAGLARGMRRPLLIIAEEEEANPIDYRDSILICSGGRLCVKRITDWLEAELEPAYGALETASAEASRVALAADLASLRLGDPVAENEEQLLSDYFVDTAAFRDVLAERTTIFVGRKGAGKTANMLQAAERLSADARNLVCVIKPVSYEWDSVIELLRLHERGGTRGFLVESLWKLLLYVEVATSAAAEIQSRPAVPAPGSPEATLLEVLERISVNTGDDFAVRLEGAVKAAHLFERTQSIADDRGAISELLHAGPLRELRAALGPVLQRRERVALLIDNLDKTWHRDADLDQLATFIGGLMGASASMAKDFARKDYWRTPVPLTLAVFMRSDIYSHLQRSKREPDKSPVSWLEWNDEEMLRRVVEERYATSKEGIVDGRRLWVDYFCPSVDGYDTSDFIMRSILPRPRDLIYFCNAAIGIAVNRRHTEVEEGDVREAQRVYSQFAFEALVVEAGLVDARIEPILYEFVGAPRVMERGEVERRVTNGGAPATESSVMTDRLLSLGFLGRETAPGVFRHADDDRLAIRDAGLARELARREDREPKYEVSSAFRSYLEIG
jgi:hypothetical protein